MNAPGPEGSGAACQIRQTQSREVSGGLAGKTFEASAAPANETPSTVAAQSRRNHLPAAPPIARLGEDTGRMREALRAAGLDDVHLAT